jgi:hypothetical protein
MLPELGNTARLATMATSPLDNLLARLPDGWRSTVRKGKSRSGEDRIRVVAPNGRTGDITVWRRRELDPRAVTRLLADTPSDVRPDVIAAPYLSPEARRRLVEGGIGYVDSTGNVRLSLSEPGLFIEATGANRDPDPRRRPSRGLAGAKAGRIVRALCKRTGQWGVRELANATDTNAGYVSRLLRHLDTQALVERGCDGSVTVPDWQQLVHQWAESAPIPSRGRAQRFIALRGIAPVLVALGNSHLRHAVSGSFAASRTAPVVPPRLLMVYTDEIEATIGPLDLRPIDRGSNVLLIEPRDVKVLEEVERDQDGVCWAGLVQVAADLLSSPDRGPDEAEALIDWMRHNEGRWRG